MQRIICGDCLSGDTWAKVGLGGQCARMVFADPPDNLGMKYDGFDDKWKFSCDYIQWLADVAFMGQVHGDIFWFSYYYRWAWELSFELWRRVVRPSWHATEIRQFYWHFTFGQQQQKDFKNCHRPILRFMRPGTETYPDAIRVPSARQLKYKDRRADPKGCVPGDVWEFPRVCGTFEERRPWIPNQHPEALMERIIKFSCKPGDLVIDMFGGSFTTARVCQRLGIDCISIEISEAYCKRGAAELGCEVE